MSRHHLMHGFNPPADVCYFADNGDLYRDSGSFTSAYRGYRVSFVPRHTALWPTWGRHASPIASVDRALELGFLWWPQDLVPTDASVLESVDDVYYDDLTEVVPRHGLTRKNILAPDTTYYDGHGGLVLMRSHGPHTSQLIRPRQPLFTHS